MNKLLVAEKKLFGEIMSCDTYIKVLSDKFSESQMLSSIDNSFDGMRIFEKKYSRFIENNELSNFNKSQETVAVSDELFDMLAESKNLYDKTDHMFDIGILPSLLGEGYVKSKKLGFIDFNLNPNKHSEKSSMDQIAILKNNQVYKPKNVQIDLGGIGKGYIIDKVSRDLARIYTNYIVDACGDMYCSGVAKQNGYDYWTIAVENPIEVGKELAILMVKNKGVATSGVNRRKWKVNGTEKNHLIDPRTQKSVHNELLTVTVVSNNAVNADVMAKSLLIMGQDVGLAFANKNKIASLFVDKDLNLVHSLEMEQYVWKD